MNLHTPEQIRLARQRVADDPTAKKFAERIMSAAEPWLDRDDAFIRDFVPEASVPRGYIVNSATFSSAYATGCPIHNTPSEGFRGYPQLDWVHDPFKDRWHITCPVGGETYPSNDFEAFYRTGMQDRSLLTGPYPDDGFGWRPEGSPYRFWFIAYCAGRIWSIVLSGLGMLRQAYMLSGDARYAHKALVILDRLAEIYPDMDYATQGNYSLELSPGYDGKVASLIGETHTVHNLCEAFDAVRDAIPSDPTFGPTADATLAKLERGIVEAGIEGVYMGQVRGNYGMHQMALLYAAVTLGDQKEIDRAVEWALNNTGEATRHKEMWTSFDDYIFRDRAGHAEGVNFALDNLHFREGIGWESSPGYNGSWIRHLAPVADLLDRLGIRVWDRPRFRRMYRWPLEMSCLDAFTPAVGDSGTLTSGLIQTGAETLRTAYRATQDPLIGELLRKHPYAFSSIDALLEEPVNPSPSKEGAAEIRQLTTGSRLMGGYGLALLRSGRGKEGAAVSLYYGRSATEHGHFDRLVLELFGCGKRLIPDMGYGDHASEGDPPAIWTKNTSAHATVVVDDRRQDTQAPGRLTAFADTDGLQLVEVDAPDAYNHVSEYRRTVALVDLAPGLRYVLDLFRVAGGDRHDYGTHGFDGEFTTDGIDLTTQERGTLAGEDVAFAEIYDDPALEDFERKGRAYYTYRGSGYSYLHKVRRGRPTGSWSATWRDREDGSGLRTTFLPTDEAIVALGPAPRKPGNPDDLTFVKLRNDGEGISSQFVAVHEPFEGDPKVRTIEEVQRTDRSVVVKVVHTFGEDTASYTIGPGGPTLSLIRRDTDGRIVRIHRVGAGDVQSDDGTLSIERPISGRIVSVDPESSTIEIERDKESQPLQKRGLVGNVLRITNGRRTTAYTISSVESTGRRYRIGLDDEAFCIGRLVTTGINADGSGLATMTCLYLASQGFYRGARLVDGKHAVWLPVEDVKLSPHRPGFRRDGAVELVGHHDLDAHFQPGEMAYLYDMGPGDDVSIIPHATAVRRDDGTFRVKGNCRAAMEGRD